MSGRGVTRVGVGASVSAPPGYRPPDGPPLGLGPRPLPWPAGFPPGGRAAAVPWGSRAVAGGVEAATASTVAGAGWPAGLLVILGRLGVGWRSLPMGACRRALPRPVP